MSQRDRDILDKIADDARRLRVARKLPEGPLSWEWVQRIQQDFKEFLRKHELSQANVAKRMGAGFSNTTLSIFLSLEKEGEFIGDLDRVVRGVNQFMETHARKAEAPRPAGWVETAVAVKMLNLIAKTIELRAMGLIWSDAGRGKTMTAKAAADIYPGAIYIRVKRGCRTDSGLARELAAALRIKVRTTREIENALIEMFKGSDRPLLIDEAQQLEGSGLEFLRDLHDDCEIPIVLLGTKDIEAKTSDTTEFYAQFASRIALRYDVTEQLRPRNQKPGGDPGSRAKAESKPLHTVEEIKRIYESDNLRLTDEGRAFLTKLSNCLGLGGLRLCRQVMFVAAGVSKGEPVDAKLLIQVLRGMHGLDYSTHRTEAALEHSKVQVT